MFRSRPPSGVPVLSQGRHRSPRSGGCFMEFASFLAGERWSDHPACTHPLLAALARDVNDLVDDTHRALLVPLIPDVVGLTGTDPVIDVTVAARAAGAGLPVASMGNQRALAAGLLTIDEVARTLPHPSVPALRLRITDALDLVPGERQWAIQWRRQAAAQPVAIDVFRRRVAPRIVHSATLAIAGAVVMDPSQRLVTLLRDAVADARALVLLSPHPEAPAAAPRATPADGISTSASTAR